MSLKPFQKLSTWSLMQRDQKKGLEELLMPDTYKRVVESMRVSDWVLLYFKLQARLPDAGWQILLNLTQLGRSGVSSTLNKRNYEQLLDEVFVISRIIKVKVRVKG